MERYFDFEKVQADVVCSLEAVVKKHGIDLYHPIAVAAVIGAISSPLKLHKLQGTPLTKPLGRAGSEAYEASELIWKVEEIKSPHSLIVSPMMDAIAASLTRASSLTMPELFRNAHQLHLKCADPTLPGDESAWSGEGENSSAFCSAISYLLKADLIRELPNSEVRTFELGVSYDLKMARGAPGD